MVPPATATAAGSSTGPCDNGEVLAASARCRQCGSAWPNFSTYGTKESSDFTVSVRPHQEAARAQFPTVTDALPAARSGCESRSKRATRGRCGRPS